MGEQVAAALVSSSRSFSMRVGSGLRANTQIFVQQADSEIQFRVVGAARIATNMPFDKVAALYSPNQAEDGVSDIPINA